MQHTWQSHHPKHKKAYLLLKDFVRSERNVKNNSFFQQGCEIEILNMLLAGFSNANTKITAYQYHSRLSSGSHSFASIKKKKAALTCDNFKSTQLICFIFESAQVLKLIISSPPFTK